MIRELAVLKRSMDIVVSVLGLLVSSVVMIPVMFLVWRTDGYSPFYVAERVGRGGRPFRMVKLRSMIKGADRVGASSTSNSDQRITRVGHFIRRYKLDEMTQLWNVLCGDMSLVGPRPQVRSGVDLYTSRERDLLTVRPGITDFASIVFSDEGVILKDSKDPDADYDSLIRPWKSRLGLIYIAKRSMILDCQLIVATLMAIASRDRALSQVHRLLKEVGAPAEVIEVSLRRNPLRPSLPPGGEFDLS